MVVRRHPRTLNGFVRLLLPINVAVGVAIAATYFALRKLPLGPVERMLPYYAVSLSAFLALLVGIRLYRPRPAAPWVFLAAGQLVYLTGDVTFYTYRDVLHGTAYPSLADLFYLGHFPFVLVALVIFVRLRNPNRDSSTLLDAGIIATGVALLSWTFLIDPYVQAGGGWVVTATSLAYPSADLLVLVVALRLFIGRGQHPSPAFYLLLTAFFVLFLTDSGYGLMQIAGVYQTGHILDAGWLAFYILLGAAALHPSMGTITAPTRITPQHTGMRILALGVAALVAPMLLAFEGLVRHHVDVIALVGASVVLFTLVILRMMGLIHEVGRLAVTDELTQLRNRRFFDQALELETTRAARSGSRLGLLVVDIDNFKHINDRYGHSIGDDVLRDLAARLSLAGRRGDIVARFGGEEFVVVVPDIEIQDLARIAQRIHDVVGSRPFDIGSHPPIPVTVSVGAACLPDNAVDAGELVRAADRAMYGAKHLGRDRVQVGPMPAGLLEDHVVDPSGFLQYLEWLADEIDARQSPSEHSRAVGRWAGQVAQRLGLDEGTQLHCELAGRFHDIGKVVVPDHILQKSGPLQPHEWRIIRRHPEEGARLLAFVPSLRRVATIVAQHHERWDGRGYPHRLKATDACLEARILAVCDAWAAMLALRPYRSAVSVETAKVQLQTHAGTQFDPTVVAAFLDLQHEGHLGALDLLPDEWEPIALAVSSRRAAQPE